MNAGITVLTVVVADGAVIHFGTGLVIDTGRIRPTVHTAGVVVDETVTNDTSGLVVTDSAVLAAASTHDTSVHHGVLVQIGTTTATGRITKFDGAMADECGSRSIGGRGIHTATTACRSTIADNTLFHRHITADERATTFGRVVGVLKYKTFDESRVGAVAVVLDDNELAQIRTIEDGLESVDVAGPGSSVVAAEHVDTVLDRDSLGIGTRSNHDIVTSRTGADSSRDG